MTRTELTIDGRHCVLHQQESPGFLLLQPVDEQELTTLDREVEQIQERTSQPFVHCAVQVQDWNGELSPWTAPAVFGKAGFSGGGAETLTLLEERILPELVQRCDLPEDISVVLGGYSLAGLFALWSAACSERFTAVAAVSPSVWFPRWMDYAAQHPPRTDCVYLSLGDREEKTRNKTMARVGECIRQQHALLKEQNIPCTLEWNQGNHFVEADLRTARGFAWCLEQLYRCGQGEISHRRPKQWKT
jgi:predicted alpha/beta superfamily hydrolase